MSDREKLIELIAKAKYICNHDYSDHTEDEYIADMLLDNGVTVQKHGEWVVCGDGEYVPFMCSACGKTTLWYHKQTAKYCPNCGAKMDGEI